MEKVDVQKLVDLNSPRISYGTNNGKSDVWSYFKIVAVDGANLPFVRCNKCSVLLKWKSRDGTNGLQSHVDFCNTRTQQKKITDHAGYSSAKDVPSIPGAVKSEVADYVVQMCAKDIRFAPYCSILMRHLYASK